MAEKKKLTTTQLKNKYNRISKITQLCEYVSMAIPYIIISIVKWDDYFVKYNGTKVAISFILAMVVLGLSIFETINDKMKSTVLNLLVKMIIASLICYLLGTLCEDLGTILLCGCGGMVGALILEHFSKKYAKERDLYNEAITEAKKESLKEKAKAEDLGSVI